MKASHRKMVPLAILLCALSWTCYGQPFPNKPIQLIVPFSPGGGTDLGARILSAKVTELSGYQFVVLNVTGASGNIGAERVARSLADGYTLLIGSSPNAAAMTLFKQLSYDFVKDFVPIIQIGANPQVLVVNPIVPAKTVEELVVLAKQQRSQMTFGSAGAGAASHLAGELLNLSRNIRLVHVPYKGVSLALVGVVSGEVDMAFATVASAKSHIQTKRMKAIAVASPRRSVAAPDIPTFDEQGLHNFYLSTSYGVHAPKGTSGEIVKKLNAEFLRAMRAPEVEKRMLDAGIEPSPGTPEAYGKYVEEEVSRLGRIIREAKLQQ